MSALITMAKAARILAAELAAQSADYPTNKTECSVLLSFACALDLTAEKLEALAVSECSGSDGDPPAGTLPKVSTRPRTGRFGRSG
jgi:hypothetical protein